MKILIRIFLFALLLSTSSGVYAQLSGSFPDKVYGLDPLLHNGKFYIYIVPGGSGGNPFFSGPDFVKGTVSIRGVLYTDQMLKYDVFNQQLILLCKNNAGADNQIVVSDAWLESFNLENFHFEMVATRDTVSQIFQVLGNGPDKILYSWRKELLLDTRVGAVSHEFSELKKETYLLTGSNILKYKNNRSFIALFSPAKQIQVKKHMRQQHIRVKRASDWSITELINYCNTLPSK